MMFLNDEPGMFRPSLIGLNPVELRCYPFMINLNKYTGSCNTLSPKTYVPKETKDINVKAFNTITNKNEAKAMTANSIVQYVIQIKDSIIKHVNVNVKIIARAKKDYAWNPSTCICDNGKYLKSTSVTECDEIIFAMDIVSTKKTNVTSTSSTNVHNIKVGDCYI